jgi:hypothetical protein
MKKLLFLPLILALLQEIYAQSTAVLPNRLDFAQRTYAQILAITGMQKGSTCYDTENNCLRIYDGSTWRCTTTTASSGFNDATGCCSGATSVVTGGGISSGPPAAVFAQSTTYNNELYEVGYCPAAGFMGGYDFGAGFGIGSVTTVGTDVGFVAKYDANGVNLWQTGIAPSPSTGSYAAVTSRVNSVIANATGVYIIGTFNNTLVVGTPTPTTLTSAGGSDMFIIKMNAATGAFVWAKQFGGAGNDAGIDLTFGELGYLYFTGYDNGMSVGYCVPNTGSQKIFVGKLDLTTGASIGNGGVIVEPIAHSEQINSIVFYDNKALLVGSFTGTVYASYVVAGCGGILSGATLAGTTGREIFLLSFDTSLMPVSSYKINYGGNDMADNLNPFKATLEGGFSGGCYATKLKIAGNATGTFPLGSKTINNDAYILTLNLNGAVLPTINEVLTIQGASITGFGDGVAVGICNTASSTVNGSAVFGCSAGQNFMLSTSNGGFFNWIITSKMIIGSSGSIGIQSSKTVSKLCGKIYAFGSYKNAIQLCNSTLDAGLRNYGFKWLYNECGGCCN